MDLSVAKKILGFNKPIKTEFGFEAKFWKIKSSNLLFDQDLIEVTLHGWYDQAAFTSGAKSVAALTTKLPYTFKEDEKLALPDVRNILTERLALDPDLKDFAVK